MTAAQQSVIDSRRPARYWIAADYIGLRGIAGVVVWFGPDGAECGRGGSVDGFQCVYMDGLTQNDNA